MLTFLIVACVAGLVGLLRGGSLESLAATRLRWVYVVLVGLGMEVSFEIWRPQWMSEDAATVILIASDLLVLAFVIVNRRTPGMLLVGVGLALNALVIASNGGMPVSLRAVEIAGAPPLEGNRLEHEAVAEETSLAWLGDVIPVPVVGEVLSVGDLLLALGIAQLVYTRTIEGRQAAPKPDEKVSP